MPLHHQPSVAGAQLGDGTPSGTFTADSSPLPGLIPPDLQPAVTPVPSTMSPLHLLPPPPPIPSTPRSPLVKRNGSSVQELASEGSGDEDFIWKEGHRSKDNEEAHDVNCTHTDGVLTL